MNERRAIRSTVALVDFMMPGINGIDTLEQLKRIDDDLPVIIITAFGTAGNTREAFKRGAFDFLEKPFKHEDVLVVVRNAAAQRRLVTGEPDAPPESPRSGAQIQ